MLGMCFPHDISSMNSWSDMLPVARQNHLWILWSVIAIFLNCSQLAILSYFLSLQERCPCWSFSLFLCFCPPNRFLGKKKNQTKTRHALYLSPYVWNPYHQQNLAFPYPYFHHLSPYPSIVLWGVLEDNAHKTEQILRIQQPTFFSLSVAPTVDWVNIS